MLGLTALRVRMGHQRFGDLRRAVDASSADTRSSTCTCTTRATQAAKRPHVRTLKSPYFLDQGRRRRARNEHNVCGIDAERRPVCQSAAEAHIARRPECNDAVVVPHVHAGLRRAARQQCERKQQNVPHPARTRTGLRC